MGNNYAVFKDLHSPAPLFNLKEGKTIYVILVSTLSCFIMVLDFLVVILTVNGYFIRECVKLQLSHCECVAGSHHQPLLKGWNNPYC